MDIPALDIFEIVIVAVQHFAPNVPHVTQSLFTDRHTDATPRITHWCAASQTVGWLHAHRAHSAVPELLGDFSQNHVRLAVDVDHELKGSVQFG